MRGVGVKNKFLMAGLSVIVVFSPQAWKLNAEEASSPKILHLKIAEGRDAGKMSPLNCIIDLNTYPAGVEDAGRSLKKWLKELYGVDLPLNPSGVEIKKGMSNVILLGRGAVLKAGAIDENVLSEQGFNGFVVRERDGSLALAGNNVQGRQLRRVRTAGEAGHEIL